MSTKQFPIISLPDGFLYACDDSQTTYKGWRYWVSSEDGVGRIVDSSCPTKYLGWPVLASTNSFLGLPLIPLEDDLKKKAWISQTLMAILSLKENPTAIEGALNNLWNAAKAKKYTEEDIRNFMFFASSKFYQYDKLTPELWEDTYQNYIKSLTPSLGLPLIPDDREYVDIPKYDKKKYGFHDNYSTTVDETQAYSRGFMTGHKAAKAKKWTDEDLHKALVMKNMGYGKDHIIKSLTPSLKAIEIEMEERQFSYSGAFKAAMDNNEEMVVPKLTKDNYVIINKYIYNE